MAYNDELTFDRPMRTDLYCHSCDKTFVAMLDYQLDGNHVIQCPHCSHFHYRKIQNGKVTDDRFDTDLDKADKTYPAVRTWKSSVAAIETTCASSFMRQFWLDKVRE